MHQAVWIVLFLAAVLSCRANDPQNEVQRSAREYPTWGALDTALRVAPMDCRMPHVWSQGNLTASLAESGPHALKLYKLYARDPSAYRGVENGAAQGAQVLVKEAFVAEPYERVDGVPVPEDVVWTPNGMFRAGKADGLFLMLREANAAPTEAAWTYATINAEGELTGLGRLDACIRCHERAPFDGLYGLSRSGVRGR